MGKRIHFIAIGGSAMHNLAIALHKKGYTVSGSDDEIFDPARRNLERYGLLPSTIGWHPEKITQDIDEIILGMHARENNPELLKAQELGLKIYSYPEYLYQQSKDKVRIVIGGSHGKTSITAMILHVLAKRGIDADYMVGAKLEGFEVMVKLTKEAKYMVIEGDEYLTSPIDRRPKFHLYKPHIAIISGIAWDHINVFPTYEIYVDQFKQFIHLIEDQGALIYNEMDEELQKISQHSTAQVRKIPYALPKYHINENGITFIHCDNYEFPLKVFGQHNLSNILAAKHVCNEIEIGDFDFYKAIADFPGASNRLELIAENSHTKVYKDFAHSPSKLKATTQAVKDQFQAHHLVAAMELHTFSSLTAEFLLEYKGAMDKADSAFVYFNPHTLAHKKLPEVSVQQVKDAFGREDLQVYTNSDKLKADLLKIDYSESNLLLMSSGNFDGMDLRAFAQEICNK
jgi:UDP-N-acetylmuramate: L-alanyl-gamma-D-glutamyl-meso-diaminopimelate ligase